MLPRRLLRFHLTAASRGHFVGKLHLIARYAKDRPVLETADYLRNRVGRVDTSVCPKLHTFWSAPIGVYPTVVTNCCNQALAQVCAVCSPLRDFEGMLR